MRQYAPSSVAHHALGEPVEKVHGVLGLEAGEERQSRGDVGLGERVVLQDEADDVTRSAFEPDAGVVFRLVVPVVHLDLP